MVKLPKSVRTHCPYCNKHTLHKLEKVRKGRPSSLSWIARQKERRASGIGNKGKFSKVPGGEKPTKRVNVRFRCTECNRAHSRKMFRASKFELEE